MNLLGTPPRGFARTKQQPLSEQREQTGLAIRKRVRGSNFVISKEEKELVSKISSAGEKRNWAAVRSIFTGYVGCATPVYGAALHAAFRCREYKQGAKIFEQCRTTCKQFDEPFFVMSLRIFAKLQDRLRVQQIWEDALQTCELSDILGSARIAAAADAGDVEMAADTLDRMNSTNVSIKVHHINSAMRACWGWGEKRHKAAKYLFDLLPRFQLSPTVVSFTSLIGAYNAASLQPILSAYNEMKSLLIEPDAVFAETYIFSVLKADHIDRGRFKTHLREQPIERLEAARDALEDFKKAGLRLPEACIAVDRELTRLGIHGRRKKCLNCHDVTNASGIIR